MQISGDLLPRGLWTESGQEAAGSRTQCTGWSVEVPTPFTQVETALCFPTRAIYISQ